MRVHIRTAAALVAGSIVLMACANVDRAATPDTTPADADAAEQHGLVHTTTGFRTPESVLYVPGDDVYFVSNINGAPADKDNNGFISRMSSAGVIDSLMFVSGGRDGITLHAPKGMALVGDTIWVTDIDVLRGFNRKTGAAVATIAFDPAPLFLNDVAAGEDGSLYVTDTGIRFQDGEMSHPGPNRVYRVRGRQVSVAVDGNVLGGPNGITWDRANQRFLIVPFASTDILEWRPGQPPTPIASGVGSFDGVEVLPDGRVLISSWADSSIYILSNDSLHRAITGVPAPADIGVDTRRGRVAIPIFTEDRVEIWRY
jgi:sugar lactone lactonase YvrE